VYEQLKSRRLAEIINNRKRYRTKAFALCRREKKETDAGIKTVRFSRLRYKSKTDRGRTISRERDKPIAFRIRFKY